MNGAGVFIVLKILVVWSHYVLTVIGSVLKEGGSG